MRNLVTANSHDHLRTIEAELRIEFPADYRQFIGDNDGLDADFGGSYLALWKLDDLVSLNIGYEMTDTLPGLVIIGSDGGGEAIAFDFRQTPPPVVLVNFVSAGWDDAVVQAKTFSEFMADRDAGLPFKFDR